MSLETIETSRYRLDIEIEEQLGKISLTDLYSGVKFADSDYRYSAFVEFKGTICRLEGLYSPAVEEEESERGDRCVTITGFLGGMNAPVSISVQHKLYIPEGEQHFEEQIILHNLDQKDVVLRGYRFGFRKQLQKPEVYGGPGVDIENYRLIAVPFRLQPDGTKHDYTLDDIYSNRYQCSRFHNPTRTVEQVVDEGRGRSEGWAWSDGEYGLLIVKYNAEMIEYSMLQTENREDGVFFNFGGAAPSLYEEPFEARQLGAGKQIKFGRTRYVFYEGLWRQGSYLFREFMATMGHSLPDNYNPPVHWNELYALGWHHSDPQALAEHYNAETLEREANKAEDLGCELLYLDPGWETCEGTTTWDNERLGEPKEFVDRIKNDYGLQVGFRTIGRSYCDAYPGMYRRTFDGLTGYYAPYEHNPFYEPCVCSKQYREEKLKRITKLADAGMKFIMFDEFDWRGPCFAPDHGHPVPTTPSMHARAVYDLMHAVHQSHPEINIEGHDPVWPWGVRYLPAYFQHDEGRTFNETWGFEFMWNPLEDLLSGKALSLFYYNLAYEIPLCLHINMDADNDNCLAFWWYASTVRHLGIGGKGDDLTRYRVYKEAMAEYMSLKDLYTHGRFYGSDELLHIHVLPEAGRGVINAFNLTDGRIYREVELRLHDLGFIEEVMILGAPHRFKGGKLILELDIPPFSPVVIKMLSKE